MVGPGQQTTVRSGGQARPDVQRQASSIALKREDPRPVVTFSISLLKTRHFIQAALAK